MNMYFACSITGGREFEPVYQAIVRARTEEGHMVPTAHLAESGVVALYQEHCRISKMISGNPSPYLLVKSYQTPEDATLQIRKFLNTHKLCL